MVGVEEEEQVVVEDDAGPGAVHGGGGNEPDQVGHAQERYQQHGALGGFPGSAGIRPKKKTVMLPLHAQNWNIGSFFLT